jgi:PadR family transcriptional regulator, regulatory protein AphA
VPAELALASAEAVADSAQRGGGRGQWPEEDGHLLDQTVAAAMLSPSDYVVLGMTGLGARSGYEIKRTVELSIRFFWTISPAQVYPSLAKLEQAGLLTGRDEPQGNRPRRVYERTREGTRALRDWLTSSEAMPFELRDIGMVKLFFADALDPAAADQLLAQVRSRSEERIGTLEAIRPDAEETARGEQPPAAHARDGGRLPRSNPRRLPSV